MAIVGAAAPGFCVPSRRLTSAISSVEPVSPCYLMAKCCAALCRGQFSSGSKVRRSSGYQPRSAACCLCRSGTSRLGAKGTFVLCKLRSVRLCRETVVHIMARLCSSAAWIVSTLLLCLRRIVLACLPNSFSFGVACVWRPSMVPVFAHRSAISFCNPHRDDRQPILPERNSEVCGAVDSLPGPSILVTRTGH